MCERRWICSDESLLSTLPQKRHACCCRPDDAVVAAAAAEDDDVVDDAATDEVNPARAEPMIEAWEPIPAWSWWPRLEAASAAAEKPLVWLKGLAAAPWDLPVVTS